ncbi:MAG: immunity 17 family protein [Bacteroidales bacterium]|jgi:hypothetical protein|nr:immunity 17 family protein [Bacteroidales bacterium]
MITDCVAAILFVFSGTMALFGSITNADWLLKSNQVAFFVKTVGQKGARIFYAILGMGGIAAGICIFIRANNVVF